MKTNHQTHDQTAAATRKIKERDYWLKQLAGDLNKVSFPYQRIKTPQQFQEREHIPFALGDNTTSQLLALSNQSDLRLHIILAAAVVLLLYRYTGQTDIIIGAPIIKQEIEGDFINTVLILRNRLSPYMTFKELILQVSKTAFEAAEHQNYPLKTLLYQLNIENNQEDFPLFDVMVMLENIHRLQDVEHIHPNVLFVFGHLGGEVKGELQYNPLLFDAADIRAIAAHLSRLLETALFHLDSPLWKIDFLPKEGKNRLLMELNDTATEYPCNKTLQQLFQDQADHVPENIAVSAAEKRNGLQQLKYRELHEKSNQVARQLQTKGIGPDTIVALMVERSVEMIIGIIAILKAGAAYLPISSEFPESRKTYILKDSSAKILLTQKNLLEANKEVTALLPAGDILLLENPGIYQEDSTDLLSINTSNNLAYVIYTSGTTGKPKGAMIEHSSLVNFLYSMYNEYNRDFSPADNCLGLTNISFDVSVGEVFLPLVFGGSLVLMPETMVPDIQALSNAILTHHITFAYIPPGLLRDLYERLAPHKESVRLNKILVGVEPIKDYLLEAYFDLNPSMQMVNGYGPAEATICSTFYRYERGKSTGENIPIGKPLDNTQVLVLDQQGQLFPYGAPGELCISGAGLARGYLNRPELTPEKFYLRRPGGTLFEKTAPPGPPRKNFLSGASKGFGKGFYMSHGSYKSYIYRTGDLVRWLSDGNLMFLGRIDHQLKIRGYRIEPGEIETLLMKHKKIKDALVVDNVDKYGTKFLCAYLVSHQPVDESQEEKELVLSELREYLARELPYYMIPAYFEQLEAIPLTANGKVARSALPEPKIESETEYVAPANEIEKKMANIWKDVLNLEKVGTRDNFFELGGNSLSILQLTNRIKQEMNLEIPEVKILEFPTIQVFVKYIGQQGHTMLQPGIQGENDPYESQELSTNRLKRRKKRLQGQENV